MNLIVNKLKSTLKVLSFVFAPGATTETEVSWQSMKNFGALLAQFIRVSGSSAVTMTINVATDESGTDSAVLETKTFDGQPDAVGDYVFMEIIASQIRQKGEEDGKRYSHVSVVLTVATDTDTGVVNYILGESRFSQDGLTADNIA